MSRSHRYHSDQWARPEGGREGVAPSREPYQGLSRSIAVPRSDGYGFAPLAPRLVQHEDLQVAYRDSVHPSIEERLSPVSEFLQGLPAPHGESRMGLEGNLAMPPAAIRPSPYESLPGMGRLDRRDSQLPTATSSFQSPSSSFQVGSGYGPPRSLSDSLSPPNAHGLKDADMRPRLPTSSSPWDNSYQSSQERSDYEGHSSPKRSTITVAGPLGDERSSKRYRGGRDEFEGSVQYLQKPPRNVPEPRERDLPPLPIHLDNAEQEHVLTQVNMRLSQCAFDFVALYRFPIPIEPNKPAVQVAADKGWTEWAYLLKRLATKRKIPSHAIYQGLIKELTTVLDNSLEMRHATKPQPRALKDDRTVLQFISAGIQVGKMLKDASTMEYLDKLYRQTESVIQERTEPPQIYR